MQGVVVRGGNNGSSSCSGSGSSITSSNNNGGGCRGGGGRSVGAGGRKSGRRVDDGGGVAMRKGPWVAEEDEILMEYVRKHGPRDWSSIRSKGLLPRTGKSCRLRWVNKLKPDLKTGCKFSPEEERTVIDLQAQFGNKWARIATYLPGRTDNDVKNFWSTRQKRLARILRTPLPGKSSKGQGKAPAPASLPSTSQETSNSQIASLDLILFGDQNCFNCQFGHVAFTKDHDAMEVAQMPDEWSSSYLQSLEEALLAVDEVPVMQTEPYLLQNQADLQLPFDQTPQPLLGLPLVPEGSDFFPVADVLGDMTFPDELVCQDASPFMQLPEGWPLMGLEVEQQHEHQEIPDDLFDDFPSDMFDYLEQQQPPAPQQQPPTASC